MIFYQKGVDKIMICVYNEQSRLILTFFGKIANLTDISPGREDRGFFASITASALSLKHFMCSLEVCFLFLLFGVKNLRKNQAWWL